MEKQHAEALASVLDRFRQKGQGEYEVEMLETKRPLQNFHQWANGKPLVAAFRVTRRGEEGYYYLLIDWHRNGNYYLVIYQSDISTTVAEIHRTETGADGTELIWKYMPLKRDGKNDERKAFFQKMFGQTTVQILLPNTDEQVESFFQTTFALCHNRLRADQIVQKKAETESLRG